MKRAQGRLGFIERSIEKRDLRFAGEPERAAGLPLEPESTPASERRGRQEAKSSHED